MTYYANIQKTIKNEKQSSELLLADHLILKFTFFNRKKHFGLNFQNGNTKQLVFGCFIGLLVFFSYFQNQFSIDAIDIASLKFSLVKIQSKLISIIKKCSFTFMCLIKIKL